MVTAISASPAPASSAWCTASSAPSNPPRIVIDQLAPTANRRSTTATYSGALDPIRKAFARADGVSPALFSANSAGACETGEGTGVIYTDLSFVDGIASTRESCQGRRLTVDVLAHRLDGRSIGDVLEMTV
ncbi:ABC transporter [Saccharopolyspora spinosa]|uniref:ABC transporter n=1 Tax=Saccharopolyspora spinosa TaxID=60894 RepID=UPI0002379F73|nr:ABC transporter [Saccharopolyspora spinosa]